jgi:hypothetical protein
MPSQICDKSGTRLISTAGGSLDAKYHDARDDFGESSIFSLSSSKQTSQYATFPELNQREIILPLNDNIEDLVLSGNIPNFRVGIPLTVILVHPDGVTQNFSTSLTNSGDYRAIFSINENSLTGLYKIRLSHNAIDVGAVSFTVLHPSVPDWVKNNAKWWSIDAITDSEFVDGLEDLIEKGFIKIPSTTPSVSGTNIPGWIKITAQWWSNNDISDEDFLFAIEYLIKIGTIRI